MTLKSFHRTYDPDTGDEFKIPVGQLDLASENYIHVSQEGDDDEGTGSIVDPYATVTKAFTEVTDDKKTIFVWPGEYAEATVLTWPSIQGVSLIGLDNLGSVVISNAHPHAAAAVISINPTFTSDSFEAFLENITISHEAQVGLQINNTNMGTKKLLIEMKDVGFEQVSTGNSIDVDHTLTTAAIRIYAIGSRTEIEGAINIVTIDGGDRFRFKGFMLSGGLVTDAGAVASEITLDDCSWTSGAITGGHSSQKLNCINCYTFDGTTYAALGSLNTTHANVNVGGT